MTRTTGDHRTEDLRTLVQTFVRRFGLLDQARTPCGAAMTISAAHALSELARSPGIDQNELARRLGLSKSAVSRLSASLEGSGLLVREPSDSDGRAWLLRLTTKGERLSREIAGRSLVFFGEIMAGLPAAKVAAVFDGLSALIQAIPNERGARAKEHAR